ncbi:MAG: hypothetical protein DMG71_11935 [Acidobacteria bacterium]|nr:MAG: hypothetical protein DMG71_11935 [Acidobacteriota bacterium]
MAGSSRILLFYITSWPLFALKLALPSLLISDILATKGHTATREPTKFKFVLGFPKIRWQVTGEITLFFPKGENMNHKYEAEIRHCFDCDTLTEALRDLEQQCREAEDKRRCEAVLSLINDYDEMIRDEERYLARIRKLEHRRNCALELLLKHQRLEHA